MPALPHHTSRLQHTADKSCPPQSDGEEGLCTDNALVAAIYNMHGAWWECEAQLFGLREGTSGYRRQGRRQKAQSFHRLGKPDAAGYPIRYNLRKPRVVAAAKAGVAAKHAKRRDKGRPCAPTGLFGWVEQP